MDKNLKEQFQNPGADKRSIPFWAWNGRMDEEELKSQVRQMKQAGVGGFFIHSRIGLETEYLGEEWMNCVKAVVAEAKEQGLYAWLYDEDRWPSGTAGGRVTSCGDAYRCKGLTLEVLSSEKYADVYRQEIQPGLEAGGQAATSSLQMSLSQQDIPGKGVFCDEAVGVVAVYCAELAEESADAEERIGQGAGIPENKPTKLVSFQRLDLSQDGSTHDDTIQKESVSDEQLAGELAEHVEIGQQEVYLVVRLEVSAPSQWFNNEAPPDNLNPDCVRKFIEETHEKYKQAVGEEFGKTIPGIFTDEPSLNDRNTFFGENKSWIPWTYGFGAYFEKQCGYNFFDVLPLFYFQGKDSAKVRHDYWQCVTRRYSESYFKVIGEWCEENHLLFTGHFLQEDKLGLSTRVNGAIMPHYQYQHVPGIDMLCEQTKEYITVKQCTSVAHQLGKRQVLSETYGCTGWEFTFEGQKWMGDWQYVLGVNRRCQHLMLYSLRGCRKRDYPPCFNYNTNWWQDNKIVDDYFARLAVVLEQGEAVRNILLLHPASTAWSRLGVDPYGNPVRRKERDVPKLNEYGDSLNKLIEYLERQHLDCDLGDELLIEQFGQVVDEPKGRFVVGEAKYQAVVLSAMDTILPSTCELLLEYMEQGGCVYVLGAAPYTVGGGYEQSELLGRLINHDGWITVDSKDELIKWLNPYRTICIEEAGQECQDVLYQLREDGEEYYLFLVNNNRDRSVDVNVRLPFRAEPIRMELLSGEIVPENRYEATEKETCLPLHLGKADSAVFCLQKQEIDKVQTCNRRSLHCEPESSSEGVGKAVKSWSYRLDHKNVMPLDMCRYRMQEEEWSEEMEVWQAQKFIREKLDMQPIHHNGIEQRYKWIGKPHPQNGCKLELAFTFESELELEKVALALERPEDFAVALNGQEIAWEAAGWLLDKEIRKCKLPKVLRGTNQLVLSCNYRNDYELENIYLEGDFAVTPMRHLDKLPEKLAPGDWTEQGLKHYCGSVTYLMEYVVGDAGNMEKEALFLCLPSIAAVCVKVRVNGNETILPWDFEQELPIGRWMKQGKNLIEVEVVGSPRNMMGPFHLKAKPYNTNDASFTPSGEKYSMDYLLVPYGVMGEIKIV